MKNQTGEVFSRASGKDPGLQYGPAISFYLAAVVLVAGIYGILLSPGQPGRFCSMRINLEGYLPLSTHLMGGIVHTPGYDPGPQDPDDPPTHILSEAIEGNPYVHYVNPYVFWTFLAGVAVCLTMALILKVEDLVIGESSMSRKVFERPRTKPRDW